MSKVRFISDLHFGHKLVAEQRGVSIEDHDDWLIDKWNSVVTKRDLTFVLGDITLNKKYLPLVKKLNGNKHLVMGNHDTFAIDQYLLYFNKVYGVLKYKGFWLSHTPMHQGSLRGLSNIHGHDHHCTGIGVEYKNVTVESLGGVPISLEELK